MTPKPYLVPLAVVLLAGAGGLAAAQVIAQQGGYDPGQLPAFHGTVQQYDLTPRGDVDGVLLADGTEVHFPPHLGLQVTAAIRPGDAVTIRGLKARMLPLVQAMAITADKSGTTITDDGPPAGPPPRGPQEPPPPPGGPDMAGPPSTVSGIVKLRLHGPRADFNGVLLDDGTELHLPPPEADRLSDQLQPGRRITARGGLFASGLGRVMGVSAIGPSADQLTAVAVGPPPPPPPGEPPPPPAP
ncbi:hypothetical protein [Lichenicoccus sp.]|uniref:hypothetical protein n=1 Tax=Lichenicoccus sp. TaxID=2781899 RepID=UPI003D138743